MTSKTIMPPALHQIRPSSPPVIPGLHQGCRQHRRRPSREPDQSRCWPVQRRVSRPKHAGMAGAGTPETHSLTSRLPSGQVEQVPLHRSMPPTVVLEPDAMTTPLNPVVPLRHAGSDGGGDGSAGQGVGPNHRHPDRDERPEAGDDPAIVRTSLVHACRSDHRHREWSGAADHVPDLRRR
jgi:hypothetical protein